MRRYRILALLTLVMAGISSCAPERKVNCDMVNLQRQEGGLSVSQMAAGFQVSEADINKCAVANVPPAESESAPSAPESASPEAGAGGGSSGASGGSASGSPSSP